MIGLRSIERKGSYCINILFYHPLSLDLMSKLVGDGEGSPFFTQNRLSHGLVISGANFYKAPTDLRLPDLWQNQKMMLSSLSFSYRLFVVFICFVLNTGKRIIILSASLAMHGRQDSTTSNHGIVSDFSQELNSP